VINATGSHGQLSDFSPSIANLELVKLIERNLQ
jgi:hypothetical protein